MAEQSWGGASTAASKALSVVEDLYEALGVSIIAERAPRIQPVPLKKAA